MKLNRFYVYVLIDSRNNVPFYVGKGTRRRTTSHIREAKKDPSEWTNALKCRRINSIWNAGGNIIINQLEEKLTEEQAYECESYYINKWGLIINNTGCLTNIIGSDRINPRCYKKADQYSIDGVFIQTFDSVQEAASACDVTENHLSGVLNERPVTGGVLRTAGGYRWVHHGEELRYYNRYDAIYEKKKKRICQYTISGNYIRTFNSAKEAFETLGISQQGISRVCNGTLTTCSGFCWAFEGDEPRLPKTSDRRYGLRS